MTVDAFSVFHDPMFKASQGATILTLMVPDGKFMAFAKLNLDNDSPQARTVTCRLHAGVNFDTNHVRLAPSGVGNVDNAALAFTVVNDFVGNSTDKKNPISLDFVLDQAGANVAVGRMKITACKVDNIANTAG